MVYVDIDECSSSDVCAHNCVNFDGGYECSCEDGFVLGEDGMSCEDIDECSLSTPCDHTCVNLPGEFHCECEDGYVLEGDGVTCTGMYALMCCGI